MEGLVPSPSLTPVSVDVAAPPASDALLQRLLDNLLADLGDAVIESTIRGRDAYVRVPASSWAAAARAAKRVGFDYFCFLSGMDWLQSPVQTSRYENIWGVADDDDSVDTADTADTDTTDDAPDGEPADGEVTDTTQANLAGAEAVAVPVGIQTGHAGGETRFQVMLRLTSSTEHRSVVLRADLTDDSPTVASIASIYGGANWHERETWEMFGFWFDGHPNLVHIYLPGSFEGYPLRKDFPLLAREVKPWPGLINVEPIAGEADDETPES